MSGTSKAASESTPVWRRRLYSFTKWFLIVAIVLVVTLAGIFYVAYKQTDIPDPNAAFQAQSSYVYYSGGKDKIGQFSEQNRESIPLSEIPKSMQDAAIAAEDRTFYTNSGIDPKGIVRAAFSNAQGNATQGASTITQQYVKLLYLSQQRTLSRKVREAFLSLKVQQEKSKQEILQGYLNTIYFGRGAYGVQAAANAYFGIPAKKLNVAQSAMLAAVLNNPAGLSPDRKTTRQRLKQRYDYVLRGMTSMGTLDAAQADKLEKRLPKRAKPKQSNQLGGQNGFMLALVKSELRKIGFDDAAIEGGGLRVETTFTKAGMEAAQSGIEDERPSGLPDGPKGLHVASASVDVKTGALIGFYGGQDYLKSQLNWAQLGGSPGSAFKPFALAAGIKDGFSLKDTFQGNSPYTFPNGDTVVNEGEGGGTDYGASISLLTATEQSVNTAFVDLTESMTDGPKEIKQMAVAMGIPADAPGLKATAGISLGSLTVSPITMANAYATIPNRGLRHDWFTVKKVSRASDGKVLYQAHRQSKRVLDQDISDDVSYALQEVVKVGTGKNALALGRPAAGKTGTATNGQDHVSSSWFVGFTPQVSTAVMYVRGRGNEPLDGYLPSYFGADYPTRTWEKIMSSVMEGMDEESFPPPAFVDGTAPTSGHAPYVPPATPTYTPVPVPTPQAPPPPTHQPKPTKKTPAPAPTPGNGQQPPPGLSPGPSPGQRQGQGGGFGHGLGRGHSG